MFRTAFAIALSLAVPGLAAFAIAQESSDEQYMPVGEDPNWYLQRAGCTLAHSVNGDSLAVVRLQISMGVSLEFVDPALRNIRQGASADFTVTIDGVAENSYGIGLVEQDTDGAERRGYRLSVSDEMLDRIAAGRRLEAKSGGRTLLRLDLAGAGPAIAALRECHEAMMSVEQPLSEEGNSMGNAM